jgi:hypothetical protein
MLSAKDRTMGVSKQDAKSNGAAWSPSRHSEVPMPMPFFNLDNFAKNPNVKDFGGLLTVQDMVRFVEGKQNLGCGRNSKDPPSCVLS